MTLGEISVIVAQAIGKQYDSSFLEIVESLVSVYRQKLIRQRLTEAKNDREYFLQGTVMQVQKLTEAECSELGLVEDCVVRTCKKVPKMVRTNIMFDYVGAENFRNPFSKTNPLKQLYNSFTLTRKEPTYLYVNEYLYIDNFEGDKIGVRGISINPIQMTLCNVKVNVKDLCEEDIEYDCPGDIIADIIDILIKTKAQVPGSPDNSEEIKTPNE